jgi:beta-phosphoglucomutase-like phosphatase (HAD superfamily)
MKVLLLDMDGVITKSPRLSYPIRDRVCSFVSKKLKVSNTKAQGINEHLYKQFGHTLIGLQKIYDPSITLQDFCSYVYDPALLKSVTPDQNEINYYNDFVEKARSKEVPIFIFTNAPAAWCKHLLQSDQHQIIGCDHHIYAHNMFPEVCLKPCYATYFKVMQHLRADQYIFVDDSIQNLLPMMHNKYWKVVWMNNDPMVKENMNSHVFHTINNLEQLFISL